MDVRLNKLLSRYDYFQKAISSLGKLKPYESPSSLKELGLGNTEMSVATRLMKSLEMNEPFENFLCLLSTLEIANRFYLAFDTIREDGKSIFVGKFSKLYNFLYNAPRWREDFNNMLRLFIKKPYYFYDTECGKLLLEEVDGDELNKKRVIFSILADIWYQLISDVPLQAINLQSILSAHTEFYRIQGRDKIIEIAKKVLRQSKDVEEIMFIDGGLKLLPDFMEILAESTKGTKYRIIHSRNPSEKWKKDYPFLYDYSSGNVTIFDTGELRMLVLKDKCGYYSSSKSIQDGGKSEDYLAFYTKDAVHIKVLEYCFEYFWKQAMYNEQ